MNQTYERSVRATRGGATVNHASDSAARRLFDFWIRRSYTLWVLAATIFVADQVTKAIVSGWLARGESWPAEGFLRFTHIGNSGTAFSLFQGNSNILSIAAVIAIILLLWVYKTTGGVSSIIRFALGLQLGGAFGNLFDRVTQGYVTDFIDVGPWPIFNIADSSITIGMVLMLWFFFTMPKASAEQTTRVTNLATYDADSCPRCAEMATYGKLNAPGRTTALDEDPS